MKIKPVKMRRKVMEEKCSAKKRQRWAAKGLTIGSGEEMPVILSNKHARTDISTLFNRHIQQCGR